MRKWAFVISVVGFFGLAIVGWCSGVSPLICGLRALIGAAALYVGAILALRLVLAVLINAALRKASQGNQGGDLTK
ncbi:MAG TPA: hypothetical protein VNA25_26700 [Phycisphaerae bacterium]|nr:hypothetical protein [Phycisphaerae bacterium]